MIEPAPFAAPWEARIFALVRTLRDSGHVTADEWTDALRARVGDGIGDVSYHHWVGALEDVLAAKGVV